MIETGRIVQTSIEIGVVLATLFVTATFVSLYFMLRSAHSSKAGTKTEKETKRNE